MTVDSWQPAPAIKDIDPDTLTRIINAATAFQSGQNCTPELNWIQPFTKIELSIWQKTAQHLTDDQIILIIKLLTTLETELNWDLADKSPVIALFKAHKKRSGLDRELVQWVKANTDNKYLPFGPLL